MFLGSGLEVDDGGIVLEGVTSLEQLLLSLPLGVDALCLRTREAALGSH